MGCSTARLLLRDVGTWMQVPPFVLWNFRHSKRGYATRMFPAIINQMSFDCDAAEEFQPASAARSVRRVLAALLGVSAAVSSQSAIAAPSFSVR